MDKKAFIKFLIPKKSLWAKCYFFLALCIALTVACVLTGHPMLSMLPSFPALVLLLVPILECFKVYKAADNLEMSGELKKILKETNTAFTLTLNDGTEVIFGNTYFFKQNSRKVRIYNDIKGIFPTKSKDGSEYLVTLVQDVRGANYEEKFCRISTDTYKNDYPKLISLIKERNQKTIIAKNADDYYRQLN